ncbi:Carboxyl-terminal processing protease [Planctomycetales bacterium 10988]|nr:Carboxyl-terminal processing protease [Planctomycetales bacterium 10988]
MATGTLVRNLLPMRQLLKISTIGLMWASCVFTGWEPSQAWSQELRLRSTSSSFNALDNAFQVGKELEASSRWSEALTHYEEVLREYPDNPVLLQRIQEAKIHYGISRRYSDVTFRNYLIGLDEASVLSLYEEVLNKVHTHYVHEPNWQAISDRGTYAINVALNDATFKQTNLKDVPEDWINQYRTDLKERSGIQVVRSRQDAIEQARLAGRLARRHLGTSPTPIVLEFVYHAIINLDDYSSYLTPGQLEDLYSQIDGNFVGLGIELQADQGTLLIVNVIEGSPAYRVGIRPGDRIVSVENQSLDGISTDQAASMLQGAEGTFVQVTVRSESDRKLRQHRIERRRIEVPSVDKAQILDPNTGLAYFRLTSFQKTTLGEIDATLWKLHRDGMRSLVIDLRGNPGGLLPSSVEVADRFIAEGQIVSTRGRSPDQNWTYSAHRSGTWYMPLIVLIDGDSASAAEIFSGAIRDHRRGYLVGETTYGKGSVQSIFSLENARSGLRLTTAKFYSPLGRPFNKIGVSPHITVHSVAKATLPGGIATEVDKDPVILEAMRLARDQFAKK